MPEDSKQVMVEAAIVPYVSASKESIEKFYNGYDHNSFVQVNPNILNKEEIRVVFDKLLTEMKQTLQIVDKDFHIHICFFLLRVGSVGCSSKTQYTGGYEYVVDSKKYSVKDVWIFPTIKSIVSALPNKKPNGLKAFCSSLQDLYLLVAPMFPESFSNRTVGVRGVPKGEEYLGCDFLTATSPLMDNHQRAISLSAQKNAIERSASNTSERRIVSLYDIGKFVTL
ncbi:minor capsid protein p25 [Soybean leaf crinkle mottle virus]|nr:minor capsid protein p25 [Soybean leaf crinkle mottle virus]